jgi:LPXTG-motif cell wall-anchored protein
LVGVLGSLLVVVGQANAVGVWGQATPAVFAAGVQKTTPSAEFLSVSCGSVGNCTAVGYFKNVAGDREAFTMTSTAGTWGQATPAVFAAGVQNTTPSAEFLSVSCGSVGNCTAVGYFKNVAGGYEAFTMTAVDDTPAPTTTAAPVLPATGSEVNRPFVAGLLALVAGVMVTLRRRRSIN